MQYCLLFLLLTVSLFVDAQSTDRQHTHACTFRSDSIEILVYIPLDSYGACGNDPALRRKLVDSLLLQHNAVFVRQDAFASLAVQLTYRCPPETDPEGLEKKLQAICSEITVTRS